MQGIGLESGSVRKPNLPDLGTETVFVAKIDTYGAVLRCTHPNAICIPNRTGFGMSH